MKKIRDAPIPTTKRELRSFMGIANYYRAYIPNFSDKCLDLTNLIKKGTPNKLPWKEIHTKQFKNLKTELCTAPVLRLPDM